MFPKHGWQVTRLRAPGTPFPKEVRPMATHDVTNPATARVARPTGLRRLATETKAAVKTTEFYAYIVVLAGILIAGLATKTGTGHDDRLVANNVWLFATILTVGYMVSRGLAKSGSREPYTPDDDR
jgi:hypothetical protein